VIDKIEPLSVAVHAVANIGAFRATQSIVVFGCGPVGLLTLACARALGASRAIGVDVLPSRLEFAKRYAATDVWLAPKPEDGESKIDYAQRNAAGMKKEFGIVDSGPGEIDLVVDASGAEVSIATAIFIAKAGGTFVQ
jgi:D-xylulose reductase